MPEQEGAPRQEQPTRGLGKIPEMFRRGEGTRIDRVQKTAAKDRDLGHRLKEQSRKGGGGFLGTVAERPQITGEGTLDDIIVPGSGARIEDVLSKAQEKVLHNEDGLVYFDFSGTYYVFDGKAETTDDAIFPLFKPRKSDKSDGVLELAKTNLRQMRGEA